jgi:hypothetical protein
MLIACPFTSFFAKMGKTQEDFVCKYMINNLFRVQGLLRSQYALFWPVLHGLTIQELSQSYLQEHIEITPWLALSSSSFTLCMLLMISFSLHESKLKLSFANKLK